jgi:hypothetical protein
MLLVRIKQLRGGCCEWSHYFYDAILNSETLVALSQFFSRKAKEAQTEDPGDITWNHTAYKFAEEKVLQFKQTGVKHTLDWSLEIQTIALERL